MIRDEIPTEERLKRMELQKKKEKILTHGRFLVHRKNTGGSSMEIMQGKV